MSSPDETAMCGSSRETVKEFLNMHVAERDALNDVRKQQIALAFQHIEWCWQGHGMPDLCNRLWNELKTMTWEKDENGDKNANYDPHVAKYMLFARYPWHDEPGTEDNPLKNLA